MLPQNHCLLFPTISLNFGQHYILFITALSMLLAIPGNFLITYTIFKSTTLWNQPSFRCIASVSIADFFVALVGQPLFLTMMTTPYNPYLHCVTYAIVWTICSASGFGVIFITIERYLFIEHPLKYEVIFNEKRALYLILCQWLLSIAFGTIPLIYRNDKIWSSFYLLTLVFANILMIAAYYKIRKSVIKHQKMIKQAVTSTPEETTKKPITKPPRKNYFLFAIVIVFCGNLYPLFLICLLRAIYQNKSLILDICFYWSSIFAFLNSSFNIFIYGLGNKLLRKEVTSILRRSRTVKP